MLGGRYKKLEDLFEGKYRNLSEVVQLGHHMIGG